MTGEREGGGKETGRIEGNNEEKMKGHDRRR